MFSASQAPDKYEKKIIIFKMTAKEKRELCYKI